MDQPSSSGNPLIGDLSGLGKIADSMLTAIRAAVGTLYRPRAIRKEGEAQADAEAYRIIKLAEAETRAKLIRGEGSDSVNQQSANVALPAHVESSSMIALEQTDTSLRERAGYRLVVVELRHQANLETIFDEGFEHSRRFEQAGENARPIDDDWISAFIDCAQTISHERIRGIWSKILASQATEGQPTISRATLDALRLLEPSGARMFETVVRMFILTGQIMSTSSVAELEFNIDSLEAMNLIDIGFLRRVDVRENTLDINKGILMFMNEEGFSRLLTSGKAPANDEDIFNDTRELRIDRCLLTSRGFELAAVLFPDFYDFIGHKRPAAGSLIGVRDRNAASKIIREWAGTLSRPGTVLCMAAMEWENHVDAKGDEGRQSSLRITSYFDPQRRTWRKLK